MAVQNNVNNPVDGEVIISVPPNFSVAYVTIYPAQNGGKDVTYDDVISALAVKGVKYNINEALIRSVIENKEFDKEIRAAEADMPVDGKNGTVTYKYDKEQVIAPQEDEKGFVDYKNLGLIRNIHENDEIAVITLPEEGKDGKDIRGVAMKAAPGKPAPYTIGTGTKLSDNGLKIVAAIDGHVCYRDKTFCVEPVVTIKGDVDVSVGNIDFLGDVVIKGEVMEGFTVTAGKDITIGGNVYAGTTSVIGEENITYTIPGEAITDNVVITVTKTKLTADEVAVTIPSGVDVTGDVKATIHKYRHKPYPCLSH